MQFVVIRDAAKRQAVAYLYADSYAQYKTSPSYIGNRARDTVDGQRQQERVADSADYLAAHMGEAPVLVIGCNSGPSRTAAERGMGNILPAMWSFMLAARARSLGTAWTTLHTVHEREVADLLGIPYDTVAQAVLTPVAYTKGTDFKPATRPEPDAVIHWDSW